VIEVYAIVSEPSGEIYVGIALNAVKSLRNITTEKTDILKD
jgi:hypothetical protein